MKSLDELILSYKKPELRLDLGCGYYKPDGYLGIDNLIGESTQIKNQENLPDILMSLEEQLPFEDNSVDEIRSSHFLEHSSLSHIIDESHRVLKPNGIFYFIVPYANSAEGMYPGHNIFLTENWFHNNLNFQSKFKIIKEKYYLSSTWNKSFMHKIIPFHFARKFLFNTCWQMAITSTSKKDYSVPSLQNSQDLH